MAPSRREPQTKPLRLKPGMWWILVSFTTINLGALPLWLVYLSQVMWPTANLGVIGAIQTISIVAALLGWRPTDGALGRRAIIGVLLVVGGSVALIGVGPVAESATDRVAVLIVTVMMTFGMTYASLALLEMAHRLVLDQNHAVRAFTLLDVVDSSSLQVGLFTGGLLTTWSANVGDWMPYIAFVVAMSVLALASVVCTALLTRSTARRGDDGSKGMTSPGL